MWQDMAGNPIFLSEAQLVVADPCAELQQWHIDSASGRGREVGTPQDSCSFLNMDICKFKYMMILEDWVELSLDMDMDDMDI